MKTILNNEIKEIRIKVEEWKKNNLTIGLVPTMGALHKGHESLIQKAKELCDKVIVSIFVNPIQFGPTEDYDKYPRTIEKDSEICEKHNVDLVFAPTPTEMYSNNGQEKTNTNFTFVYPPYNLVDKLCGKTRPGHFDGVATVVTKLFNITQPDYAFFGQKDAQQLIIINKMVNDLNIPIKIIPCEIVREDSGLALSSRNKYLSLTGKEKALSISKSLFQIKNLYSQGIKETRILADSVLELLDKKAELEYLEFVDYNTLEPIDSIKHKTLVAIAAKIDNVRLIDNIILGDNTI